MTDTTTRAPWLPESATFDAPRAGYPDAESARPAPAVDAAPDLAALHAERARIDAELEAAGPLRTAATVRQAVGEATPTKLADDELSLTVDMSDLTIDDIDVIEEVVGRPLDSLTQEGGLRGPMLRAVAMVAMNRRDPARFPIGTPADRALTAAAVGKMRLKIDNTPTDPPAPSGS